MANMKNSVQTEVYLDVKTGEANYLVGDQFFTGTIITSAAGIPNLTLGTANAAGTATTAVRTDATILAFDGTVPVTQASADAAAAGTATVAARRDHKHGMPTIPAGGTPAVVLGTAAAAGSASTFLRTDDTILAFDATTPSTQASGDAGTVGAATTAARRDHKHVMPTTASVTVAGFLPFNDFRRFTVQALGSLTVGTTAVNFALGDRITATLAGAITFTFSNPVAGHEYQFILTQDGTGSRVVTWPTVKWSGGTAPTLTTTLNKIDIITFTYDGTSYFGSSILNY